ncbi:hypothetical protein F0562_005981 [Nyssa sinensis]|uniref:GAT domain-containing protein n=1 Tax=Nyssa sinensis TaxID=561372 RepID=A0A5J5AKS3_9ASTE|nr:hypothetical protein F0562_005981 [Nyssa sinensis]
MNPTNLARLDEPLITLWGQMQTRITEKYLSRPVDERETVNFGDLEEKREVQQVDTLVGSVEEEEVVDNQEDDDNCLNVTRDEKVVSRAIDLNEQLEKVLARHDALVSGWSTSTLNHFHHEEVDEEEEAEQLFRRIRKGKACAQPEDEEHQVEQPLGLVGSSIPGERMHRPLIRPLSLEPSQEPNGLQPAVAIPPPPAKHIERERFFQENKLDGSGLAGHMRGLSLHSRNASSSRSGSLDSSD